MSKNNTEERIDVISKRLNLIDAFTRSTKTTNIIGQNIQYPKKHVDLHAFITRTKTKLKYVSSGSGGHTFRGSMRLDNGQPFYYALKLVPMRASSSYGNANNVNRPENAEINALCYISKHVKSRSTPHIMCPITTFNTDIDCIRKLHFEKGRQTKDNKKFKKLCEYLKLADDPSKYHPTISVLISEWANSGDLLSFLRKKYRTLTSMQWRVIMFQLLHPLAVIHRVDPKFRHNDFKANNILLHEGTDKTKWDKHVYYRVGDTKFKIPNMGLSLRIWDFDFACIPGKVDNDKVTTKWCKKINVTPKQNQYYDVHYFFYTLFYHAFLPDFFECKTVPKSVIDFIHRMVPPKARVNVMKRGRTKLTDELLTPLQIILNDPFFNKFRTITKKKTNELSSTLSKD